MVVQRPENTLTGKDLEIGVSGSVGVRLTVQVQLYKNKSPGAVAWVVSRGGCVHRTVLALLFIANIDDRSFDRISDRGRPGARASFFQFHLLSERFFLSLVP